MAVSAAFAVQAYADFGQLWLLYVLAMVQAVLQALGAPARRTFVARLVPTSQLTRAIALNTLSGRVTMLFSPAPAGVVAGTWGLRACYAIDTVSFALPGAERRALRRLAADARPAQRGTGCRRAAVRRAVRPGRAGIEAGPRHAGRDDDLETGDRLLRADP